MPSLLQRVLSITESLERKEELSSLELTELVKSLIKSESQAGGPYLTDGKEDIMLNVYILRLFKILNKELPNVESYINEQLLNKSTPLSTESKILITSIFEKDNTSLSIDNTGLDYNYSFYNSFVKSLQPEVRPAAIRYGDRIMKVDQKGEVTNLAIIFYDSLKNVNSGISIDFNKLGHANFMIWVAYSIYDSIIDGDENINALSTANIAMRKAIETYKECAVNPTLVSEYTNKVDSANAWELEHCRFVLNETDIIISSLPTQSSMEYLLENRAIAHIIGPVSIAESLRLGDVDSAKIKQALKYYCIARQLNDDLHDWMDDFIAGRITYVVSSLLRKSGYKKGVYDTEKTLNSLKNIFYESELERLCSITQNYVSKSSRILAEVNPYFKESKFVKFYLNPIGDSAVKAMKMHRFNKSTVSDFIA